ncbi:MAG: hypothetical protein IJH47_03490 [Oscillospiraceae bacterium]|nr:hypothetical protein [Oscillospiraceae bacterium]
MLEASVKNLFEYQRFERNAFLQGVIDEVLEKYARVQPLVLMDEDLAKAAGGVRSIEQNSQETDDDGRGKV